MLQSAGNGRAGGGGEVAGAHLLWQSLRDHRDGKHKASENPCRGQWSAAEPPTKLTYPRTVAVGIGEANPRRADGEAYRQPDATAAQHREQCLLNRNVRTDRINTHRAMLDAQHCMFGCNSRV